MYFDKDFSRPTAYRSYYQRVQKTYILNDSMDRQTDIIKDILAKNKQSFDYRESLTRGLHWNGYTFGKRQFNHNGSDIEYYIHQWKNTNDLGKEHPTGTRGLYHSFDEFAKAVEKLVVTPPSLL